MTETSAPPVSIVEFLTARLDEDEDEVSVGDFNGSDIGARAAERLDADIAAKRAIIHQHGDDYHECPEGLFMDSAETEPHIGWERECPTLRHLASVYSDHPEYRQEWKP